MKIIKIKDCYNCNYVAYIGSTTEARWQCTNKMENGYFIQFSKANNVIDSRCPLEDYDDRVVKTASNMVVCPSCDSDNCSIVNIPLNRCNDCGTEWQTDL
jgi:hypothetical protein